MGKIWICKSYLRMILSQDHTAMLFETLEAIAQKNTQLLALLWLVNSVRWTGAQMQSSPWQTVEKYRNNFLRKCFLHNRACKTARPRRLLTLIMANFPADNSREFHSPPRRCGATNPRCGRWIPFQWVWDWLSEDIFSDQGSESPEFLLHLRIETSVRPRP